jgi:ATP-dependent DNA helicase Q1
MINNHIVFYSFGKVKYSFLIKYSFFFRFGDVFRLAPMAFSDKSGNGLTNLYSMISYCLNQSQCRRKLIAKYFDEVWQSNDCNQMCDICTRPSTDVAKRNCREEALIIIDYLQNNNKQRLTALKLIDQISIKTMIKIDLQRLILQLIIDQYLKEDFHFTSYNTICYIKPGPRAEYIKNENCQILLDIIESSKKQTSTTNKKVEKPSTQKKSKTPAVPGTD